VFVDPDAADDFTGPRLVDTDEVAGVDERPIDEPDVGDLADRDVGEEHPHWAARERTLGEAHTCCAVWP
jgi:hypothetical protein